MNVPPRPLIVAAGTCAGLIAAGAARLTGHSDLSAPILCITLLLCGAPLVAATLRGMLRGRFAADVVASLAIVGAAILGEYFAGAIVVLMQAGGEALDAFAMGRASRSLEALLARAPRQAHRRRGAITEDIPVDAVQTGDALVLRPGDMVPVDCVVTEGESSVDASALTGEPIPVHAGPGVELSSGSINQEGALLVRALRPAIRSQYQQIVQLVEQARAAKAPIQRVADRFAVWFTPLTLAMCVLAWLVDHQASSVLAVLVVATPCPLILATPIAVVAGIGRAARRGIIVRNGAAIESVARAQVVVFDKTGTLTVGRPRVTSVQPEAGWPAIEMMRLAGAVEQLSSHHVGQAIAGEAARLAGVLPHPTGFHEQAGQGVEGWVAGTHVAVGTSTWVPCAPASGGESPSSDAVVCIDGIRAGTIRIADMIRPEAPAMLEALRALGIRRIVLLSGDRQAAADAIGGALGIGEIRGDLLPAGKVEALGALRRSPARVLMVGDGINDAPALAAADVSIAMGAHAPAAAAQAADIVLLTDDIGRVAEAVRIGRRTRRIALQSIGVGVGVSFGLMLIAALGHIPPAVGALLQEALDVAVILNALRARGAGR